MPRIRVRTPNGERIVGTANCSTLTIKLVAHAQRSTLQLLADAQLTGNDTTIERWSWDFPEFSDDSTIELISEPGDFYDPPDKSYAPPAPVRPRPQAVRLKEMQAVEKEFLTLAKQLDALSASTSKIAHLPVRNETRQVHCSFCGRSKDVVRKLVAGPTAHICDECIQEASKLISET